MIALRSASTNAICKLAIFAYLAVNGVGLAACETYKRQTSQLADCEAIIPDVINRSKDYAAQNRANYQILRIDHAREIPGEYGCTGDAMLTNGNAIKVRYGAVNEHGFAGVMYTF